MSTLTSRSGSRNKRKERAETGCGVKTEDVSDDLIAGESTAHNWINNREAYLECASNASYGSDEEEKSSSHGSHVHATDPASDLSSIDELPAQPVLLKFPVSLISGRPRRFTAHWYTRYGAWLEYSIVKDAIFCKVCRHFGNNLIADKFTRGFRNWKRIYQACSKHEASKAHCSALFKYTNYKDLQQSSSGAVPHQVRSETVSPKLVENNREHLKVILDVVIFCARHQPSFCDHKQNEQSFSDLFDLLAKYDTGIKTRFDAIPQNTALNSWDVQNDLINAAASLLLRRIKQELHDTTNTYYAILMDSCKDQCRKDFIVVYLRYLYRGCVKERAVGFVDVSSEGTAAKISQLLEPFEMDPDLCVGFGFCGTPATCVHEGELGSTLKGAFPRAACVHYHSQCLNSALCNVSKTSGDVSSFFEITHALYAFLTRTHGRFLEIQKELHPVRAPLNLSRGGNACWSSTGEIVDVFEAVMETLSECAESEGSPALEAQCLLQQMQTKKFTFLLVAFSELSKLSDFATKGLQSSSLSVTDCIESIEHLKQSLANLRNNDQGGFNKILTATNELVEKNEITNWDLLPSRKRKLHVQSNDSTLALSTRARCDDDLRALWYWVLDCQMNELGHRFRADSYDLMKAAALLQLSSEDDLAESIIPVCRFYGLDLFDAELPSFSQTLRETAMGTGCQQSLIEILDCCSEEHFPNLHVVIKILLTVPVSACTPQRLSSSVNAIKAASQSSVLTAQLNPLSLLTFEKDLTDTLDYDEIIEIFYFLKFIKPFMAQDGTAEPVSQSLLSWKTIVPV